MPLKIQEAYITPNRLHEKRKSLPQIMLKTGNIQNKERILNAARERRSNKQKQIYQNYTFLLNGVSTSQKGMNRCATHSKGPQMPNQNNTPSKTFCHHNGENKTSHDKNKFKQHSTANSALQKVIKRNAKFMKLIISLKTQRVNNRRTPKSKEVMSGPISMCICMCTHHCHHNK